MTLAVLLAGVEPGWHRLSTAQAGPNTAPSFTIRTLDGKVTRLTELRGRPVVVDFWATWCRPCRASIPHLSQMQDRFASRGLVVLGMSLDDGDPQKVRDFANRLGVHFRVGMADEKTLDDYGPIRSIPTTFFLNRQGEIVRRVVGYIDEETLESYVREIL
jgi:cytochrome c biogenesis protein CcmG/thiol:disulfide interchange protein DsbE